MGYNKCEEWFCEEAHILRAQLARDGLHIVLYFSKMLIAEIMSDSLFKYLNAHSKNHTWIK